MVKKALDILDLFTLETRELTVAQIADKLQQPQSTVYRYLRTLKERGYVMEGANGYYKLGYKFLYFAKVVRADNVLMSLARPLMQRLTKETGETSILTIASGLYAVCLDVVTSNRPVKVSAEQGKILPLYAGASSKALLAYLGDEKIDELFSSGIVQRYTPNTIISKDLLYNELKKIRGRGYSYSSSEVDEGVTSYGVPVFNMEGEVVAALSIAGPSERLIHQDAEYVVSLLREAANEMQPQL